jgi:hypothetical protein
MNTSEEEISIHPHARERMTERGASEAEVLATIQGGERFPAKFGRTGFRRNFTFDNKWRDRHFSTKQVEVYAVKNDGWYVITVIVRYF